MTGESGEDAAALQKADIGIAYGARGDDYGRARADIVCLDNGTCVSCVCMVCVCVCVGCLSWCMR